LLRKLSVSCSSRTAETLEQIKDLGKILSTNYVDDLKLPSQELLHELAEIVASLIVLHDGREWKNLSSAQLLSRLFRRLGPREIELHAHPYLHGAGLKIRGFFCRTEIRGGPRFVIFVNTAHHPGAAAASLGHELGHYIYDALRGETAPTLALLEGSFARHFYRESELFADSLVSLSAYSREKFRDISRDGGLGLSGARGHTGSGAKSGLGAPRKRDGVAAISALVCDSSRATGRTAGRHLHRICTTDAIEAHLGSTGSTCAIV